jgi:hypothetical protein
LLGRLHLALQAIDHPLRSPLMLVSTSAVSLLDSLPSALLKQKRKALLVFQKTLRIQPLKEKEGPA